MPAELAYIDWISGRPEQAVHDLGSSDLQWEGSAPLDPLPLDGTTESRGSRPVRESVADIYDVPSEQVLLTAGATHANVLTFAATLDGSRRNVLVERPGYEPLWSTPPLFGADVDRFDRSLDEDYSLDTETIETRIGPDTALVIVTNRHNPSGRELDRETLARVASLVADHGAWLLVDEVYAPFGDGSRSDGAFGGPTAAGLPGVVVTSSLTKFHGLDGLRIGWAIADEPVVDRLRTALRHIPTVSEPSHELGRRVFAAESELSARSRSRCLTNADRLRSFVDDRPDLSGPVYEGSNFGFLQHARADGDAVAAEAWDRGVLVVPGRFFGDRSRYRVSLAGDPDAMEDGLAALGRALDAC